MKIYILVLLLGVTTSVLYGQNSKSLAIDTLLKVTRAKESTQEIIGGIIRQYLSQKPNAPKALEEEIQKSLNYDDYMMKIKIAYDNAYLESEIISLRRAHQSGDLELFKQKSKRVENALYDIGNVFGKEAVQVIVSKLKQY